MRRIPAVVVAAILIAAFACTDPPIDSPERSVAENPLAPSFSASIETPAPPSTICKAYERDLAELVALQEAEPSEERALAVEALEAITTDVCN